MSIGVIVVAAGAGRRFGGRLPKAFQELCGKPLFLHCIAAFGRLPGLGEIVLVVPKGRVSWVERRFGAAAARSGISKIVEGGARRQDSVGCGLAALGSTCDVVLIHDAARPFVTTELASRVARATRRHGAAVPALALRDTVKRVKAGIVKETPDRASLVSVQTPQGVRAALLRRAYAGGHADEDATDDVQLVERLGERVVTVAGDPLNLKITSRPDLLQADYILTLR
jgi:2-C-methyl-D-erythritol 4-phosphate cytidylyltransferase